MHASTAESAPGKKLGWAIVIGLLLALPLFSVWLLVYDRQSQSRGASESITAGWGGRQQMLGPQIVLPHLRSEPQIVVDSAGRNTVQGVRSVRQELTIAPDRMNIDTIIKPEVRRRSIYSAVVYEAAVTGKARFILPPDLPRTGADMSRVDFARAELRFGISDPRGIGANPSVTVNGKPVRLQPGGGSGEGTGFFAWIDASSLASAPLVVDYSYSLRGNGGLALIPRAGDTRWTVKSSWVNPSFQGGFLPVSPSVSDASFTATYRIGNLALGRSLAELTDPASQSVSRDPDASLGPANAKQNAEVSLIEPVDLYSRVDRSAKYGFLFIGFTFLALLLFDVIGGAPVSRVEYLLMGAALVQFFVLLLAFAEVIGFTPAYVLAAAAIAGLNTAYSAAVLKSWRRASFIGALLVTLYAVLYVLLSLEAYSLLIGSLLLLAALAGVMYVTRNIDWNGHSEVAAEA
ncbi:MAG: cell envelope integrity protein CreD [Sphingomicrobium sp.]